ncbi:MAG: hypothetical protein IPH75_00220 [bacterium]|nr:hypothetical protein [bacterium]
MKAPDFRYFRCFESGRSGDDDPSDGDYAYVVGNHGVGGLEIFDISNPAAPVEVGGFQPFYYHDIAIRNDTLYAAGIYGEGIDVVDVSNKTSPSLIKRFNYPRSQDPRDPRKLTRIFDLTWTKGAGPLPAPAPATGTIDTDLVADFT